MQNRGLRDKMHHGTRSGRANQTVGGDFPDSGPCESAVSKKFDLVAIGRASIGDPDWANKVKASRFGEIRRFDRQQLLEIRNQIT